MNNNDHTRIIAPDELFSELQKHDGHFEQRLIIINVLPSHYFNDCHIANSINIESSSIADYVQDWDRLSSIVLYEAGEETELVQSACKILDNMGFSDVRTLQGGMSEWLEYGYPSTGACTMNYLHD